MRCSLKSHTLAPFISRRLFITPTASLAVAVSRFLFTCSNTTTGNNTDKGGRGRVTCESKKTENFDFLETVIIQFIDCVRSRHVPRMMDRGKRGRCESRGTPTLILT